MSTRWLLAAAFASVLAMSAGLAQQLAQQAMPPVPGGEAPTGDVAPNDAASVPSSVPQKSGGRIVPAKTLFGAATTAAPLEARAIGGYARGCLAGAKPLAIDGENWQAMRLSRNRNWGHPQLIAVVERLAVDAKANDGWSGLLVGDLSQPRGGPMLTGHASHQVGLDADIWLTPMPNRRLSAQEREDLSATSMLGPDGIVVDPKIWTAAHGRLIRRAASYVEVERVLVHPGIKKALCEENRDRANFNKIRPIWGHHYHMHVRLACPKGNETCRMQPAVPGDDGCGKEIEDWMQLLRQPPKPVDPTVPKKPPPPPLTLADLPPECRLVIEASTNAASASMRRVRAPSTAKSQK